MTPIQRSHAIAVVISLSLGLACSKHSGLDRGASSDELLAGSPNQARPSGVGERDDSARDSDVSAPRYASPPAAEQAQPDSRARASSNAAAPASPAPRGARAEAPAWNSDAEIAPKRQTSGGGERAANKSYAQREERPGLATAWGETRRSEVVTVSFQREHPETPAAIQRIFYNNAAGIAAQTGERSLSELGPNWTELGRGFVSVEIVNPEGMALPGLTAQGKSYVLGAHGERYSIRIRNNERYRVEVVATVDGLDVLDGTQGNFRKRGYIVDPQSTMTIDGFRRSTKSVAAFRFGSVSESYAARTGSDRQVGVIGIAAFPERDCCRNEFSETEIYRRETADPFPGEFARPPRPRTDYRAY